MLLTRGAVQICGLLQKIDGIEIEDLSIEGRILLSASRVCGRGFDLQQYNVLFGAGEHCLQCVVEVSSAQSTSEAS